MPRPNQDRVRVNVWVSRQALGWADTVAAHRGITRSDLLRELLSAGIKTTENLPSPWPFCNECGEALTSVNHVIKAGSLRNTDAPLVAFSGTTSVNLPCGHTRGYTLKRQSPSFRA